MAPIASSLRHVSPGATLAFPIATVVRRDLSEPASSVSEGTWVYVVVAEGVLIPRVCGVSGEE